MNVAAHPRTWSTSLIHELFANVAHGRLDIQLPGGSSLRVGDGQPEVGVRWSNRATARVLGLGMIGLGDGYVHGDWDVTHGSLLDLVTILARSRVHQRVKAMMPRPAQAAIGAMSRLGGKRRAGARNARFHYDVDADFYRLWLDSSMTYTCGYARSPADSLEIMQANKLALIHAKLGLQPGHRLLDLGCGWGSLAEFCARQGAEVTAVNVSSSQLDWIRASGRMRGLPVELRQADFRDATGSYDRIAAVGLAEHVGKAHLPELFATIANCLRDDGLALIHTIGSSTTGETDPWIERRIFPGSYVPALSELVFAAETVSLRVVHIENLGPHYALTLRHWLQRFVAAKQNIVARYGASMFRTWELYLTALVPTFEYLSTSLFQMLVSKGEGPNMQLGLHTIPKNS